MRIVDILTEAMQGVDYRNFESKRKKAVEQLEALINKARIEELEHIDDPVNVNLYYEGLISVADRIKTLRSKQEEQKG